MLTPPRHGSGENVYARGAQAPCASRVRPMLRLAARAALLALLAGAAGGGDARPAAAQQAQRATLNVPASIQAMPASTVRLSIRVGPPDALAKNSFVRVRGLPAAAALSDGHAIAPGAWAVPLAALPTLTIVVPTGLQGRSEVAISLVSVEGTVLAEASTTLVIATPQMAPAITREAAPPPAPPARAEPVPLPAAERDRALGLHAKGLEQLERGNVYAARKFFERGAEVGLAQSAVALAGTYDPDELSKLKVLGLQPDVAAARTWYEKARELGAPEASERLRRLGSR